MYVNRTACFFSNRQSLIRVIRVIRGLNSPVLAAEAFFTADGADGADTRTIPVRGREERFQVHDLRVVMGLADGAERGMFGRCRFSWNVNVARPVVAGRGRCG